MEARVNNFEALRLAAASMVGLGHSFILAGALTYGILEF
jgi:hypothetical protein